MDDDRREIAAREMGVRLHASRGSTSLGESDGGKLTSIELESLIERHNRLAAELVDRPNSLFAA